MHRFAKATVAALALLGAAVSARPATASIVERVVAVVGERPILLSELQHRGRPFLFRILAQSNGNNAQIAAAKTEMEKELLNRMIDDRLEESAADKARLSVTSEEVDNALRNISANAHVSLAQLLDEAKKQGLSEQDYREEIRRQVLEGKLVQLRVRGRVRVTEEDARAAYQRFLAEAGKQGMVDLHILSKRIPPGSTLDQVQAIAKRANQLVAEARRPGADFCALVAQNSDDTQTKSKCGSRGPLPQAQLFPELQAAIAGLKPGEVTEPVPVGTEAVLVVQVGDSRPPSFEEVKEQMMERAYTDAMEHQHKLWLEELRRGIYVDVRL